MIAQTLPAIGYAGHVFAPQTRKSFNVRPSRSDWSRFEGKFSDRQTVENPFPLIVLPLVWKAVPWVTGAFRSRDRS